MEESKENVPMELGLDGPSKILLALGGLGSLILACLLAYGVLRVGLLVLHRLAQY